jgi:ssRNA-specific RNase YbeY (16S rRNA maturation enzyme)
MQRITRASNADTHPGLLDKTSTCHTTEEVQAEHQAKAVAKANTVAEKQANIKKVAQLENKARDKVNDANCKANHPTDKLTIPQAKRARKEDATGTIIISTDFYFTDSYFMQTVPCRKLKQTPQRNHQKPKRLK